MTVEVIRDLKSLLEFRPQWASFARECKAVTPFQLPEWLLPWWQCFGSGTLQVFVFSEGPALTGVIPCFLHDWDGARQLTLIGSGISDYLEPATDPQHSAAMVECLESHLRSRSDWDRCNWQDLSACTPLKAMASQVLDDTPCTEIPLTGGFEEYWAARSANLRRNVHRDDKKLAALGKVQFCATREGELKLVDKLLQLHTARWQKHGEPGMVRANGLAEFLRHAALELAREKMLRIFSLKLEEKVVAIILSIAYRGTLFNYLTGFDPCYETAGVGRRLLFEAIRYGFGNGFKAWNFLRGDEPYKSWWGARPIAKCRVIVKRTS